MMTFLIAAMVVLAAMVVGLCLMAEVTFMVYLWWAVCQGYFGILEPYEDAVVAHIVNYIWTNVIFLMMVLYDARRSVLERRRTYSFSVTTWTLSMFLYGDECTRVAVDVGMARFTGQDLSIFEYRSNVWIWWTKIAVQYALTWIVLRYWGDHQVHIEELQEVLVDHEPQEVMAHQELNEVVVHQEVHEIVVHQEVHEVVVHQELHEVVVHQEVLEE